MNFNGLTLGSPAGRWILGTRPADGGNDQGVRLPGWHLEYAEIETFYPLLTGPGTQRLIPPAGPNRLSPIRTRH